ncbi:hypothetical protein ASD11_01390 [Aeromicrobium sp. Root495]|uniref:hypothetical protein n=1 Tax=Aeromicrobium sp. Root495 TaxID=1736550 RepID=UPI0006F288C8|nr:hypothetical protein [Aeromicrobium sp. Root495]KQY58349.1 hypothetical protein ASD11_01390 [Aeromicrobium sp. Root495]
MSTTEPRVGRRIETKCSSCGGNRLASKHDDELCGPCRNNSSSEVSVAFHGAWVRRGLVYYPRAS